MDFNEYQKEASKTNLYPKDNALNPLLFGLAEETGEVLGKFKKYMRGDLDKVPYKDMILRKQIVAEAGDILWYISQILEHFNIPFSEVPAYNIEKLRDRHERGEIKGSGDNR